MDHKSFHVCSLVLRHMASSFIEGFRNLCAVQGVAHRDLEALAMVGEAMEDESAMQRRDDVDCLDTIFRL